MSVYAIGDVQGCYDELRRLLERLRFDPTQDRLWLVGDVVNRGFKSLETLRFLKQLGDACVMVLGNHDLHLLALNAGVGTSQSYPRLRAVFQAPDREALMHWLRHRPLLHHEPELGFTLVHAGLPPQWDLPLAQSRAEELQAVLRGDTHRSYFQHMYGDHPERWSEDLAGWDRLRYITNAFTRLRFCDAQGRLDMRSKGPPGSQSDGWLPWFEVPGRKNADLKIVFGHWSLLGVRRNAGLIALDSGCVWGGRLTAVRLDAKDLPLETIDCPGAAPPSLASS